MKNEKLAQKIKTLRNRKGFTQEELSDLTGLSLRTIQRIENGETEPRGDSIKRLALAFNISSDEIIDWTVQEDKGFLVSMNLSALSFIFFPLLGILVPLIIWISKKDKIRNANEVAKDLLNFQITWSILLFVFYIWLILIKVYRLTSIGDISIVFMQSQLMTQVVLLVILYLYNFLIVVVNSVRINSNKSICYYPKIRFLR